MTQVCLRSLLPLDRQTASDEIVTTIKLTGVPTLRIDDVPTTKQFYGEFLGFQVDWEHYYEEGAPVYMQMSREGLVLHMSQNERFVQGVVVFVETRGLDELHGELTGRNTHWEIPVVSVTPWNTKQMEIQDPFGNLLRFNESVE